MSSCDVALSKEQFCHIINFMKDRSAAQSKIDDLFSKEFTDSIFLPYSRYETEMLKLLEIVMHDTESNWISYFIYDLDFGKEWKEDSVLSADNVPIPLRTPEELYNMLVEEY